MWVQHLCAQRPLGLVLLAGPELQDVAEVTRGHQVLWRVLHLVGDEPVAVAGDLDVLDLRVADVELVPDFTHGVVHAVGHELKRALLVLVEVERLQRGHVGDVQLLCLWVLLDDRGEVLSRCLDELSAVLLLGDVDLGVGLERGDWLGSAARLVVEHGHGARYLDAGCQVGRVEDDDLVVCTRLVLGELQRKGVVFAAGLDVDNDTVESGQELLGVGSELPEEHDLLPTTGEEVCTVVGECERQYGVDVPFQETALQVRNVDDGDDTRGETEGQLRTAVVDGEGRDKPGILGRCVWGRSGVGDDFLQRDSGGNSTAVDGLHADLLLVTGGWVPAQRRKDLLIAGPGGQHGTGKHHGFRQNHLIRVKSELGELVVARAGDQHPEGLAADKDLLHTLSELCIDRDSMHRGCLGELPLVIQHDSVSEIREEREQLLGRGPRDSSRGVSHHDIGDASGREYLRQHGGVGELDRLDALPGLEGVHAQLVAEGHDERLSVVRDGADTLPAAGQHGAATRNDRHLVLLSNSRHNCGYGMYTVLWWGLQEIIFNSLEGYVSYSHPVWQRLDGHRRRKFFSCT